MGTPNSTPNGSILGEFLSCTILASFLGPVPNLSMLKRSGSLGTRYLCIGTGTICWHCALGIMGGFVMPGIIGLNCKVIKWWTEYMVLF